MPQASSAPHSSNAELPSAPQTIIWLLLGPRLGDNQQLWALGAALEARFGWRVVNKQMKYFGPPVPAVDIAHAIDHVDQAKADPIVATPDDPWPDIVIGIGRRTMPVGRWIKEQGKGIHIQLGRIQDPFDNVDLLVTTAQYGLPRAGNTLHLSLPITARKKDQLAQAAADFAPVFAPLGKPLIGVLVGGPTNPIQFGAKDAARLVREGLAYAAQRQGTLAVATSPRTPDDVVAVLKRDLPAPHRLFVFEPGAGNRNPYPGLLALADAFIVTTDSVSMVADAALAGREVRLFDLPVKRPRALWKPSWPLAHWAGRRRNLRLSAGKSADVIDRWYDDQVRHGRAEPTRYVPIIMNRLLRERHVALLADPEGPQPGLGRLAAEELDMVIARILALMAERRAAILRDRLAEGGGLAARAVSRRDGPALQIGRLDPVAL